MKTKERPVEVERVLRIHRTAIRPFTGQPRKYFNQVTLRELADSVREVGQVIPILVKELDPPVGDCAWELVDGQRRWHACDMAGVEMMKAIVCEDVDDAQQFLMSVVSNFGREGHTALEEAYAVDQFLKMGKTEEQTAKVFGHSITWVMDRLSLLKLEPAVQKLLEPTTPEENRLAISTALLLVDIPAEEQIPLAQSISGLKLGVNQAKHLIRKTVAGDGLPTTKRRRPKREFDQLQQFFHRTFRQTDIVLDTEADVLREILLTASSRERTGFQELIQDLRGHLQTIAETLDRVYGKRPKK